MMPGSKDVIGDPSRPGTNDNVQLEPRRGERKNVFGMRACFHFNQTGENTAFTRWEIVHVPVVLCSGAAENACLV